MYREKIVDLVTGEETFRNYSKEEIEAVEAAQREAEAKIAESEEKAALKKALLEKLGLSEDEAKLLLG